eukprot:869200-Prorocentrum_minimum.AAC.1
MEAAKAAAEADPLVLMHPYGMRPVDPADAPEEEDLFGYIPPLPGQPVPGDPRGRQPVPGDPRGRQPAADRALHLPRAALPLP